MSGMADTGVGRRRHAALADALDIHDQQMQLHTAGELESALVEAIKRMRAGDVLEVA